MYRLVLMLLVSVAAGVLADLFEAGVLADWRVNHRIECKTNSMSIPLRRLCNGRNDCFDNSDEDAELCRIWRNQKCLNGRALCTRNGFKLCLRIEQYCIESDPPCEGDLDRRLCKMLSDGKLQALDDAILPRDRMGDQDGGLDITPDLEATLVSGEDFNHVTEHTIKGGDCPPLFTRVGDMCLSLFFVGNMTWGESEQFCSLIGGKIFTPKENSEIHEIAHHIRNHPITTDFWIGGNFHNNTVGWRWINGTPMELHTNDWAVEFDKTCYLRHVTWEYRNATEMANEGTCYNYHQAPFLNNPHGSCVAMTFKRFYFMSDEGCNLRKSPLCRFKG